ncbi:MAG: hypothetical protein QOF83_3271 [Solirubrobacteraceae bacterium]|nr:hypothetical protein [Solirubrobacteraceae bacterium]
MDRDGRRESVVACHDHSYTLCWLVAASRAVKRISMSVCLPRMLAISGR